MNMSNFDQINENGITLISPYKREDSVCFEMDGSADLEGNETRQLIQKLKNSDLFDFISENLECVTELEDGTPLISFYLHGENIRSAYSSIPEFEGAREWVEQGADEVHVHFEKRL